MGEGPSTASRKARVTLQRLPCDYISGWFCGSLTHSQGEREWRQALEQEPRIICHLLGPHPRRSLD